jgi:precorrin-6A/cobalt-precorrin-6A reductase
MSFLRILILGGTNEARAIADQLVSFGHDVTTSLAGVTTSPILPAGKIRIGGFGGVAGLADYVLSHHFEVLADITHPFAATMSHHAFEAAEIAGCRLLRFERAAWQPQTGDRWIDVTSLREAAAILPEHAVVLLTTGRKDLGPFLARSNVTGLIRTVEPVADTLPSGWRVILDRPPQSVESETALLRDNGVTHLVTKNAGGDHTRAKLEAARLLGLPVVMVQRPVKPICETVSTIEDFSMRLGTPGSFD